MLTLREKLTQAVSEAFAAAKFDSKYGVVVASKLADFQSNGALSAAKQYQMKPREIANQVAELLRDHPLLQDVLVAGTEERDPAFINLRVADEVLAAHIQELAGDTQLGCRQVETAQRIVIDFGGPNVAKPLHIGHLRSAIIGESLKRIARFLGHQVVGDVHLGDWGLQMGLVICEIRLRYPDLPYFDEDYSGSYPDASPVTVSQLEEIYPAATLRAKESDDFKEAARQATLDLQNGRRGYRALWRHLVDISIADMRRNYDQLGVEFDLWLGESDVQAMIPDTVARLQSEGHAVESQGAIIVDGLVDSVGELPPLLLIKSDGAALYGTTDLATISQRISDLKADFIWYVVDSRQRDHFRQVFNAAYKVGIAPESISLEHLPFGTVNGSDGRPYRTRDGGVLRLEDLLLMVREAANEAFEEVRSRREVDEPYTEEELEHIPFVVGIAALKFGDLINDRAKDYVFDLDRFISFEGKTGPFVLYAVARIKSILRRAARARISPGLLLSPTYPSERALMLKIAAVPEAVMQAFELRAPHILCNYLYELAALYSDFYNACPILRESDVARRASLLELSRITAEVLDRGLSLLGIETLDRM